MQTQGMSEEIAVQTLKQTQALAMANGVAPGAVLRDMAKSTETFAKFTKEGGKNLLEAAVQARKLGLELKLGKEIILRHPFPGPGLAIRMPGVITDKKIKILQEADHIYITELKKHNLYNKIWQAYAALLPVKTVGVMGDNRTYEYICLLRAITSDDGMTADFFNFNKKFMQIVSNKIINNTRGINRVVYDVTSKPPSTIELE